MRLIATETGRILQLIIMEEVRPPSGVYMPELYAKVAERYGFVTKPQNLVEAGTQGAKFNHGRLVTPHKNIVISELGIYNDGIIVDAHNTDDAEFVVTDIISWAATTFGLRERVTIIPPRFTSVVTVEFAHKIEGALMGINATAALFQDAFNKTYDEKIVVNLYRLALNVDPLSVTPLKNTQFYLERRIQRPYSENRYQSGAPLRTEDHIGLLTTIEESVLSRI